MSKKVCKVKQGLLLLCCLVAATGCKQASPTQMETEYEVMTVDEFASALAHTLERLFGGYPWTSGY